ncbi:MAG: type II toxin-antitoxin system VapC family toxin [Actinomycetota bacterium]|nr:type II toxin-antitoxin system VapC family toxin [Actinomycetota bacterium]
MTLYVDSSALLKRYVDEPDSDQFNRVLDSDGRWLTCRVTWVEVWRNLGRHLVGADAPAARDAFRADWRFVTVVEVDSLLAEAAGRIADLTGTRTLDALHLAALQRAGPAGITLLTADLRQAQAARSLGWPVLGS